MRRRLPGKVTVMHRGLDRATAARFAAGGADLLIADVVADAGEETARKIGARFQHCDVSDPRAIWALVGERLRKAWQAHVMVDVAAIPETRR